MALGTSDCYLPRLPSCLGVLRYHFDPAEKERAPLGWGTWDRRSRRFHVSNRHGARLLTGELDSKWKPSVERRRSRPYGLCVAVGWDDCDHSRRLERVGRKFESAPTKIGTICTFHPPETEVQSRGWTTPSRRRIMLAVWTARTPGQSVGSRLRRTRERSWSTTGS